MGNQADLVVARAGYCAFVEEGQQQMTRKLATPGDLAAALADVAVLVWKPKADTAHTTKLQALRADDKGGPDALQLLHKVCVDLLLPLRDSMRLMRGEDWDVLTPLTMLSS